MDWLDKVLEKFGSRLGRLVYTLKGTKARELQNGQSTTLTSQKDKPPNPLQMGLPEGMDSDDFAEKHLILTLRAREERIKAEQAAREQEVEAEKEAIKEQGKIVDIEDFKKTHSEKKGR